MAFTIRCKYCGSRLKRDGVGLCCPQRNCQWHHGVPTDEWRCREVVYKRDTYRRTGRGKSGFELHWTRDRCSRAATHDGYCWQHPRSQ